VPEDCYASAYDFLSRFIGLFTLVLALAMALHQASFVEIADRLVHDGPLLFITGLIVLAIGLAMVLSHNIWSGGALPVVITLFGWIQLVRGLIFLLAPPTPWPLFLKNEFREVLAFCDRDRFRPRSLSDRHGIPPSAAVRAHFSQPPARANF